MNNAKMWLVVPPAVGVPVFLGAVAVGSFAVHVAVLSNTTWYSDYLVGADLGSGGGTEATAALLDETDANKANASFIVPQSDGAQQVLVVLPDGTTATAYLQSPNIVKASAAPPPAVIEQ